MRIGGMVYSAPQATSLLLGHVSRRKPNLRCFSASASASSSSSSSLGFSDHIDFINDVAATHPPKHLPQLLRILQSRGESIVSPGDKQGMIPLAIPLAKTSSGMDEIDAVIALLRWPTAPPGMEMPVVEVRKYGVWLMAKTVDQFMHRILVEEDANGISKGNDDIFDAAVGAGNIYSKGDFADSRISDPDVYILKKVGLFPDLLERKVLRDFEKGDQVSAMVTGEFYTRKEHFPGFGRPFVFNAKILLKVGRKVEAKDAARGALKSPWWTLGCPYKEVAEMAEWEDEQIEYMEERVTEDGRKEDLNKGKNPAQIAVDEAAFLLDLASVDGTWDDYLERIVGCYKEAGLHDIARFLEYRD
ncbi:Protein IN CHLOROPLAST ATPASE BIOGENESIS, chloroplastic [Linum grandiflorum]